MQRTRVTDASTIGAARFGGWPLVLVLLAAYALSFVDRQILSLLVDDLRHDLAIGDTEIGLLQGPAFGVFYAVMGLPFGWLADRVNRIRLIAAGMLLWTAMTMLGGFADGFHMLFATRMGVGVGEAALVPAAVSLLADRFPAERRALPLAVFTAGVSVGAGLALVLGGALVALARGGIGGWFDGQAPWRTVLILAGLLGVPLALGILLLTEPPRAPVAHRAGAARLTPYLRAHARLFAPLLAGAASLYILSYAVSAWMPTLFVRGFGWMAPQVGLRMGGLILAGALAGNLASGGIATALTRGGRAHGAMIVMIAGAALLVPVAILGPLAAGAAGAQAGIALIYVAIALCFGVATASFVAVTPPHLRGRMAALYLSLGNLVGLGVGPPAVGLILDHLLHDQARVGAALAIVAGPTSLVGVALLRLALRPHAARAAAVRG